MFKRLSQKLFLLIFTPLMILTAPLVLFLYFSVHELPLSILGQGSISPELTEAIDNLAISILQGSFILIIAGIILAYFASSTISRLISSIAGEFTRGLNSIKNGDTDVFISYTGAKEFQEMRAAFNLTAKTVSVTDEKLRRKVQQLDAMIDPFWVVNPAGVITDINPAFTKVFGYPEKEALGSEMFDFLDEKTREHAMQLYTNSTEDEFTDLEGMFISKHSGLVPVLLSSSNITDEGFIVGRVGVIKDYRSEEALLNQLRTEKDQTNLLMDSMEDMIVVIDSDFRIARSNRATRLHYGQDPTGLTCHELFMNDKERCYIHGEDCPASKTFDSAKPHSTTKALKHSGGKEGFFEIQAFPVQDINGEVASVLLSLRDVSKRIAFEQEIEQKNKELEAMNIISKILTKSLKAEETRKEVLERAIGLFNMDGGGIYLTEDSGRALNCVTSRGLSNPFAQSIKTLKKGQDIPGQVVATSEGVFLEDISSDPGSKGSVFRHSGLKGFACIPIKGAEKILGIIFLFSFTERKFSDSEVRILNSMSEMVGISFENIRLYEKMRSLYRQDRERRIQERRDLLELSSLLASSLDMKKVLSSCISLIMRSCWADFAWIVTYDDQGALILNASTQKDFEEGEVLYKPGTSCIESRAIEKQKPMLIKGIGSTEDMEAHDSVREYTTACSVPVFLGDRTLGAFSLFYISEVSLAEEELHFLNTVGSVISVALERARLYESAIVQRGMANAILESITDAVITIDPGGRVTSMNRAAETILKKDETEMAGSEMLALFGDNVMNLDLWKKVSTCAHEAIKGVVKSAEASLYHEEKHLIPLKVQCSPVYGKESDPIGVVIVIRDLSHEHEADMLMGEFVKSVSEEFRSPLTSIIGMTEMVLEGDMESKKSKKYMENILAESRRLTSIVTDLLDLEKIETGVVAFKLTNISLTDVFYHATEATEALAKSKGCEVTSTVAKGIDTVKGDSTLLKQLVRNLVENSIIYSDSDSKVSLEAKKDGDFIKIIVTDTGFGISKEDLSKVSEKFFRGSNASKTKGTGLGLPLCKNIAEMHGGSLKVKSVMGKGTTVTVKIRRGIKK